jgi:SAM-dependent methyltransferase/DNA-binding MarR family transcriptional regulator
VHRFDCWAASYDLSQLQTVLYGPVHDAVVRYARQHVQDPGAILDVGCGTGRLPARLASSYCRARVVGVDASAGMIRSAVTAPASHGGCFVAAEAELLPFADAVFDLVVVTLSLSHWRDRAAGLGEVGRVMAPGATLVAADACPVRRSRPVTGWGRRGMPGRPEELAALIAAGGLRVEHAEPIRSVALIADAVLVAARTSARQIQPEGMPSGRSQGRSGHDASYLADSKHCSLQCSVMGSSSSRAARGGMELAPDTLETLQAATRVLAGVALRSVDVLHGAVTLPQFRMLAVLADLGRARSVQVARALGLEASTLTRLADRMVAAGYVSRGSEPGHRGVVTLELTAPGQDLVGQVAAWREQELARIYRQLPPAGQAQVTSALRQLVDAAGEGYGTISRGLVPV